MLELSIRREVLDLGANKVGKDTLLAHIIKTVEQAQGSKALCKTWWIKLRVYLYPLLCGYCPIELCSWMILGGDESLVHGLLAMVTVLVIACPCALEFATPTAIMVGIGKGAEEGNFIKDAVSLELSRKIDIVVLTRLELLPKDVL